jgi:hypothetical protein
MLYENIAVEAKHFFSAVTWCFFCIVFRLRNPYLELDGEINPGPYVEILSEPIIA